MDLQQAIELLKQMPGATLEWHPGYQLGQWKCIYYRDEEWESSAWGDTPEETLQRAWEHYKVKHKISN